MSKNLSPIQVGLEAAEKMISGDSAEFLKIASGESVNIVPMVGKDELISIKQVAIWNTPSGKPAIFPSLSVIGETCAGEQLGYKSSIRAFLPVLVQGDDKEWTPQIYAFGVSVLRMFTDVSDALDDFKGKVIRLSRQGEALKTKYSLIPVGKTIDNLDDYEMPDVIGKIQPTTREGILKLLAQCGIDVSGILLEGEELPQVEVEEKQEKWSDA